MTNEMKKFHLACGGLTDIEVQNADDETVANYADNDSRRALGTTIWNVQHEVWHHAIVTFSDDDNDDDEVYEVYVTGEHELDPYTGISHCGMCKLEFTKNDRKVYTEITSYDDCVKVSVDTAYFSSDAK